MPDISKITLPSGTTYDIKDSVAREAISGGVSFVVAWDGASVPVPENIPEGVSVKYNGTTYTGTMDANDATPGAFYLVRSATSTSGSPSDSYDEYVPVGNTGSKTWEKIGDTQIDLSDVVTDVTLNKQTGSAIGTNSTFTVTQPTIALSTGATAGTGVISLVTGISSASASGDNVTALTGLGTASTDEVLGTATTFGWSGSVSVSEGTSTDYDLSVPGNLVLVSDYSYGKISVNGSTVSASGDNVTALTGLGTPTTSTVLTGVKVTSQPSVTLSSGSTGDVTVATGIGAATTKYLSASASGTAVSASGDNVTALTGLGTASTKSAIGANSTFTVTQPSVSLSSNSSTATGRVQVATGGSDSSTTNTDWLKGVSVLNENLIFGAATQSTTYLGASASGAGVAWNSKDAVTAVTGYSSPTTDTVIGTASTFSVTQPTISLTANAASATGRITYVEAQGSANTTKISASASGTAVGANGTAAAVTGYSSPTTDTVLGTGSSMSISSTTVTPSAGTSEDYDVAIPNSWYISGRDYYNLSATGNVSVGTNDKVNAVTGYSSPTTDTVLGTGSTITVTPSKTNVKATASNGNVAWNNKDTVTALTNSTSITVTKGE